MEEASNQDDTMDEDANSSSEDERMVSTPKKSSRTVQVPPMLPHEGRKGFLQGVWLMRGMLYMSLLTLMSWILQWHSLPIKETFGDTKPRGVRMLLKYPIRIKKAWGKAIAKEAKGLIIDMNVFEKIKVMVDEIITSYACTQVQD